MAGEPAGENIDGLDTGPVDTGDVAVVGDVRPVAGEDLVAGLVAGFGVMLDVPGDPESGAFKPEVEPAAP